mmetsp:Transcript_32074/g.54726  ORF Transcript_32074/g.54726 Transcript_32074/m.54726 type:complete len:214 (-) Transcript_32074:594-1235(-)
MPDVHETHHWNSERDVGAWGLLTWPRIPGNNFAVAARIRRRATCTRISCIPHPLKLVRRGTARRTLFPRSPLLLLHFDATEMSRALVENTWFNHSSTHSHPRMNLAQRVVDVIYNHLMRSRLQLEVPVLTMCVHIGSRRGKGKAGLENKLAPLQRPVKKSTPRFLIQDVVPLDKFVVGEYARELVRQNVKERRLVVTLGVVEIGFHEAPESVV